MFLYVTKIRVFFVVVVFGFVLLVCLYLFSYFCASAVQFMLSASDINLRKQLRFELIKKLYKSRRINLDDSARFVEKSRKTPSVTTNQH